MFKFQKKSGLIKKSRGFSLVEIMVGMIIGLLGTLVMLQVYSTSEARKKATTSGGDAQTNGSIGLFNLQRELQLAGYGASSPKLMGCNVMLLTGVPINNIAPITINHADIPAGDANTDTLLVVYGNANGAAEGDTITGNNPATPTLYTVQSLNSFQVGDNVIAQAQNRAASCNLTLDKVTTIDSATSEVTVLNGAGGMNQGTLFNLGPSPRIRAYAIRNSNLTVCDFMTNDCRDASKLSNTNVWVPLVNNIVSMRAQYGRDTNVAGSMDGIVDIFDQTVASTTTSPAVSSVQCGWLRVSAIRLAIVARSAQIETTNITSIAPTWQGSANVPINLTARSDWQKYRYKKFETQVPIKNISWQETVSGC